MRTHALLAGIAVAIALAFLAARCSKEVTLGVDPASDAAVSDGGDAASAD